MSSLNTPGSHAGLQWLVWEEMCGSADHCGLIHSEGHRGAGHVVPPRQRPITDHIMYGTSSWTWGSESEPEPGDLPPDAWDSDLLLPTPACVTVKN